MILYGTNILIEVYRNNISIIDSIKQIGQKNIAVSDVTCGELLYGSRNKKELQAINNDLSNLSILPIQSAISILAVALITKHTLAHRLFLPDALMVAAITHNIDAYMLNFKDFNFLTTLKLFVSPR